MARKFSRFDWRLTSALQSTARLLGVKFLDHLVLGSADCEEGERIWVGGGMRGMLPSKRENVRRMKNDKA